MKRLHFPIRLLSKHIKTTFGFEITMIRMETGIQMNLMMVISLKLPLLIYGNDNLIEYLYYKHVTNSGRDYKK